jgi:tRNA wybutosine-synthesizing protein 1
MRFLRILTGALRIWHDWRTTLIAFGILLCIVYIAERRWQTQRETPFVATFADAANDLDNTLENRSVGSLKPRSEQRIPVKRYPKRFTATANQERLQRVTESYDAKLDSFQILIFFASLSGTTETLAKGLCKNLEKWVKSTGRSLLLLPKLLDLSYIELDDYFVAPPKNSGRVKYFYIIILPSYDIDTIINTFTEHLRETHTDFRIDTGPLASVLGYSVFGIGDMESWPTEEEGFCFQAKEVDKWLAKLTTKKRAYPLGMGDVKHNAEDRLNDWRLGLQDAVMDIMNGKGLGDGIAGSGDAVESGEEDFEDEEGLEKPLRKKSVQQLTTLDDVEDLGRLVQPKEALEIRTKSTDPVDFTGYGKATTKAPAKEMVPQNSPTYAALTKQGYSIIGSHSGVKICRWTKSALRGRGSCYKYSFYGIQSHLCMEATPSLSCSNKCVFCWRHGTNPVGTTWRWTIDPPDLIFDGITAAHYKKIKVLKGVPGVRAERFAEAMRIRHCALSLVGEPIFYPFINQLVDILHANRISTFLVCNAQHPQQLADLTKVTQLYVSIDASNKDSLRRIDKPLHRDFWERFISCMDILRKRRFEQRTVFRLTLVKGFNVEDEVQGYADLVERAQPGFIEVKGVTYCGTSASSSAGLTMQNVPFYQEICDFVRALYNELERRNLNYGIAAEHEHSCCVLMASKRFLINGQWCTRIDYDRFFALLDGGQPFGPEDYIGPATPEWALWGNGGFDPRDQRVYTKGKKKHEVK